MPLTTAAYAKASTDSSPYRQIREKIKKRAKPLLFKAMAACYTGGGEDNSIRFVGDSRGTTESRISAGANLFIRLARLGGRPMTTAMWT
jgi:hypothetical protein